MGNNVGVKAEAIPGHGHDKLVIIAQRVEAFT
jgi:hypothetical protein